MALNLDILVFAAHPDDAELGCSGTILSHVEKGYKVGVIDLTRGELGTRGSVHIRAKEVEDSSKILGLSVRDNLAFRDGFFENNEQHQLEVVKVIRKYRPQVVLANSLEDRHPDHGRAAALIETSVFLSGLEKVKTELEGVEQEAYRPQKLMHYIQERYISPDLVIDISNHWEEKLAAIKAFKSQFYDPKSTEPETPISTEKYMKLVEARARSFGQLIGVEYGEGFNIKQGVGVKDVIKDLI